MRIKPGDLVAVRLQRTGEDSEIVGSGLRVESLESERFLRRKGFDLVKIVFCVFINSERTPPQILLHPEGF